MADLSKTMTPSMARVHATTAMAQTLSFSLERKYLDNIGDERINPLVYLKQIPQSTQEIVSWLSIDQIGKPIEDDVESCFSTMQKILYSCFMPYETQLLFLVVSEKGVCRMYIGVRPLGSGINKNVTKYLAEFIKGAWPGIQCRPIKDTTTDEGLNVFKVNIENERWDYTYAVTGIPSMESQYKSTYPATIDKLLAGMNRCKSYAYLVIADPISAPEIDRMLYQCREMNGQAESMKSFNVAEGRTDGITKSFTEGNTFTHTDGTSESISKKDWRGVTNKFLGATGLTATLGSVGVGIALAAGVSFPPALAAIPALTASSVVMSAGNAIGGTLLGLMPQRTTSENHSDSYGTTNSITEGMSQSQSETISHNVVSKHIEAISEHLFYHSKRLESGKALGMWKVGAYLMAEKESDAKGGAMQLRSILSGQESIFEPIRITDISDIVNDTKQKVSHFSVPSFVINCFSNNAPFDHPLGDSFKELKTPLTTKELSYLINFPLRSVPGISVVDTVPEFSLNKNAQNSKKDSIDFGKLLYGGSETEITYQLPISALSKHTLLSGINGTGKTNTVQAVLNALSNSESKIPFLIIEPAKTEYVDWAIEYNKEHPQTPINIFIPGCKAYRDRKTHNVVKTEKLCLNPFEPVWLDAEQDPNILTHIDRLKSTFAAAFPMYDILPVLLEDLIYSLYQNPSTNWIGKDANPQYGKTMAPTLTSMAMHVDKSIEAHGYEKKIGDNMKACLNTRIASLRRGWKKEMLDTTSTTSWEQLFGRPCVINLSYVGDDVDKSFFMSLILQFLYEYRTAQAEIGQIDFNSNECRHLTVIEEAHRVMQKCEKVDEPQYKTAMMFSNMLSEIRAYGEGMFLVDQVPTRLIPDAIKNTNIKITHRLVSEDDCKAIAESMGLNEKQRPIIPKLLVGQCLVSTALSTEKHWIKVNKVK